MQYITQRSERTKLTLIIERDNSLVIRAPQQSTNEEVGKFFNRKKLWLYKKLAEKKFMQFTERSKEFVNGEGFLYLGRSHKLQLVENSTSPLRLWRGCFEMDKIGISKGTKIFVDRYKQRATERIQRRLPLFEEKLGRKAIRGGVKELRYRRGSCTKDDKIYFHRKIALAPTDVIDYIIAHELVHIIEKKHTKRFWDLLSLVFPGHEKQKRWLAENGGDLVL